jgi:hypothetical protein
MLLFAVFLPPTPRRKRGIGRKLKRWLWGSSLRGREGSPISNNDYILVPAMEAISRLLMALSHNELIVGSN